MALPDRLAFGPPWVGLDGRMAVVTGAFSGLGERFARVIHPVGAEVVVAARRGDRLSARRDEARTLTEHPLPPYVTYHE